jgi:hypothetical protein
MEKTMNSKKLSLIALMLAILCGCSPASDGSNSFGSDSPRAWFDAPLPGTILWPPNPCAIVAHGASPNGVAVFELLINGQSSSVPSPDTAASLVTLNRDCAVTEPGTYALQLRAQDNKGNWSGYAETFFVIPGEDVEIVPPQPVDPVLTLTPRPTLTPAPSVPDELSVTEVSTWVVYVGDSSCGSMETVVTARATASKGIAAVVLFYNFNGGEFQSVGMNPIGNDLYRGTISMSAMFGNSIPFDTAIIGYQVVVQQSDGDTSLRTPVNPDIEAKACGSGNSGGQPPVDACNAFTDQRTCVANNCNWWQVNDTTFICQSKP